MIVPGAPSTIVAFNTDVPHLKPRQTASVRAGIDSRRMARTGSSPSAIIAAMTCILIRLPVVAERSPTHIAI
jgi:hypothetical protein